MFSMQPESVRNKKWPPKLILKSSKLANFVQLQLSCTNICLFSIKLPILLKTSPTTIEILTMWVGPFAFRYQGNGATPCQYVDTTRKATDCATTLPLRVFI